MASGSEKELAFLWVKSYPGYSWGAWKVLARCPQLGPPIPVQKKKESEKSNNLCLPVPCLGVELEESVSMERDCGLYCKPAQIHTALAGAGSTTAHKGHWHFSTWFYSRKGPAEIECCCCLRRHMQLHCQVPLLHVFASPGVILFSPFCHWRCPPAPELCWGLTLPTCTGSSQYAQRQHRLWAVIGTPAILRWERKAGRQVYWQVLESSPVSHPEWSWASAVYLAFIMNCGLQK